MFSCGVFIDLQKAFDTVDHAILLQKLFHYGVRGIVNDWFSSYLINRVQTTQIGSHVSEKQNTWCGVPQGSVLGPLEALMCWMTSEMKSRMRATAPLRSS